MGSDGLLDAPHPSPRGRWGFIRYPDLPIIILSLLLIVGCSHRALKGRGYDPLSAREHFTLGSVYEKRGEPESAMRQYEMALDRDPEFLPAVTRLGELSYSMGQYGRAERYYRKAIEMEPRNGDHYNNLCWVYLSQGRKLKKAEGLIKRAMELTPEHRGYYLDTLGVLHLKQHRFREAIGALEAAIPFFDETQTDLLSQVYRHLGLAYEGLGQQSKAEKAFEKARQLTER